MFSNHFRINYLRTHYLHSKAKGAKIFRIRWSDRRAHLQHLCNKANHLQSIAFVIVPRAPQSAAAVPPRNPDPNHMPYPRQSSPGIIAFLVIPNRAFAANASRLLCKAL
jgi:hypothetical protein